MYKNCTFVFQSISQDTCMMPSNVAAPLPEKKVTDIQGLWPHAIMTHRPVPFIAQMIDCPVDTELEA